MKAKTISIFLLLTLVCLTRCAVTPVSLRDYKPWNAEEAGIISAIIAFEDSLNNVDQQKFLSIMADGARIMHGVQKKIFTKEEYAKILPERIKEMGTIKFSNPRTRIDRDIATVSAIYDGRAVVGLPYSFELKRVGGKWLILSNSF